MWGEKGRRGAVRCDLCRVLLPSVLPMNYCVPHGLHRDGRLAQRSPLGSQSTRVSSCCLRDCHVPSRPEEDEGLPGRRLPAIRHKVTPAETLKFTL